MPRGVRPAARTHREPWQVIAAAIRRGWFERILPGIVAGVACDTAIRAAFGSGLIAREDNVLGTLDAYVAELRDKGVDLAELQ